MPNSRSSPSNNHGGIGRSSGFDEKWTFGLWVEASPSLAPIAMPCGPS
jgi:hypothetical protein